MIYSLLIFVPLTQVLRYLHMDSLWQFISAGLGLIPLALLMVRCTTEVAGVLGPRWGGFVNVTFGNATELIISIFAIQEGLLAVVKAAVTGSILANVLLVLGLSFFLGGLAQGGSQKFDTNLATINGTMLMLAVVSLFIPAIFHHGSSRIREEILGQMSLGVGAILLLTYIVSMLYIFKDHGRIKVEKGKEYWPLVKSVPALLMITLVLAFQSEALVGAIEGVEERLGLSRIFIGVILVPLLANLGENTTAIVMARRNNLELSLNIAVGSSIQIALFVIPLLVFLSYLMGRPMNLLFNVLEIASLASAVLVANLVYLRGRSNWLEGLQLIAVYAIMALAFFFA